MTVHVLLADPDAERLAERLARPGLDVTPVATAASARAYLSGSTFDAVAVRAALEDGLAALATGLGVARVYEYASEEELEAWVEATFVRGAVVPTEAPEMAPDAVREALVGLRDDIARVAHDLANPLAVVVGTAQLGRETAADAEVAEAFADIEAAGGALAGRLSDLAALRLRLDALIG